MLESLGPAIRTPLASVPCRGILLALSFVGIAWLTACGALVGVNQWGWARADALAWFPLDILASLCSVLGAIEITGSIALGLAIRWGRRDGFRGGLAPLLLFAGVAIEVILKYSLSQPALPRLTAATRWSLPLAQLSLTHALPAWLYALPYSFPSGHMLRTTFLLHLLVPSVRCYRAVEGAFLFTMGFTRVYLNEHELSDVVGGFFLGLTLATVAAVIYPARLRKQA